MARKIKPAMSPEARENQMISLAVNLAEKQLMEGKASSQTINHYLALAADKEKKELEKELLATKVELEKAKIEALQREKHIEELYSAAIAAMKVYGGHEDDGF